MSQRLELVADGDNRVLGVYSESGALRLTPSDTSEPHGVYAKNGSYRVTLDPVPFDGVYAADGSYNLSIDSNGYVASSGILARLNGQFLGTVAEGSLPAVAFDGQNFVLPAYGPELVETGTFDAPTGWNVGSLPDWSISGGTLNKTGTSASGGPTYTLASQLTAGKLYRITYQVVSVAVGGVGVRTSGSLFSTITNRLSAGTYEEYVTPISGVTGIQVVASASGVTCVVDNLSVREVMLGELGANLGASGYTMSVSGGTGTATESPTGQLNLTGDGTNFATADKQLTGLTVGAHYRIVFLQANNQGAFQVGTSQGGSQTTPVIVMGLGVNVAEFTATATTHWIRFYRQSASLCTVSSITIAQWTPRPTLRTASFGEVFAFTASSTTARTYVGSDGLIKNDLAADTPRWDFSNGKARLLLENQSTNLLLRSNDFANATWSLFGTGASKVGSSSTAAPDGANSYEINVGSVGGLPSSASALFQQFSAVSGTNYTFSVWVRAVSGTSDFRLTISDSVSTTGSSTNTATTTWTRYTFTMTSAATTAAANGAIRAASAGGVVGNILIYGAQIEAASFASSYIPTAGATVTRLIETARFSPLVEAINALPGNTLLVKGTHLIADGSRRVLGSASAGALLRGRGTTDLTQILTGDASALIGPTGVLPGPFGAAVSFNSSGRAVSGNGGAAATDTLATDARGTLYLARSATVSGAVPYGDGYYSSFALWPFRASNANLPALAVAPS